MLIFLCSADTEDKSKKFHEIYAQYYNYAYKIVLNVAHDDSAMEDLMQTVFMNVWRSLDIITDEVSAAAWISTVARNAAINFDKAKKYEEENVLDIDDDALYAAVPGTEPDPVSITEIQESVDRVYVTIRSMKKQYAEVLLLNIKFRMTPENIAKCLNRNLKTVYTQLSRGRALLREQLDEIERCL